MYIDSLIFLLAFGLTIGAQVLVNQRYKHYGSIKTKKGVVGSDIAREVLTKNDLSEIYVVKTGGVLSDHFDPSNNVIRLSSDNYDSDSIAALAVSLHEVGHALQHKEGNLFLKIRSMLIPVVNLATRLSYLVIIIGIILSLIQVFYIGVALFGIILLFQLVTLPVEFDASKKALKILEDGNYLDKEELGGAKKVLNAAALTYVASLTVTVLEMVRLLGRRK